MNEEASLNLNLTINFSLPLDDPDTCFKLLDAIGQIGRPGCMSQEQSYAIAKQIEKAHDIIKFYLIHSEPPDELA